MNSPSDPENDILKAPAASRRPSSQTEVAHKKGARPMNKTPKFSKESQWIGFVVLGFGFMAVVAVALLYVAQRDKTPENASQNIYAAVPQQGQTNIQPPATPQAQTRPSSPPPARAQRPSSNELLSSLQGIQNEPLEDAKSRKSNTIDPRSIFGVWEVNLGDKTAIIEIEDGRYRILIDGQRKYDTRYFSSGIAEVRDNGALILSPDAAARAPRDGYKYRNLYNRPMAVQVALQEGYMIWTKPPQDVGIFLPAIHPFLRLAPDNLAVWERR